jgi:hypothetical protein
MTETRGFVCPVTGEPCTGPDCLRRHLLERAPEAWEFFDQRDETGSYAPCPLGCRAGLYLIFSDADEHVAPPLYHAGTDQSLSRHTVVGYWRYQAILPSKLQGLHSRVWTERSHLSQIP